MMESMWRRGPVPVSPFGVTAGANRRQPDPTPTRRLCNGPDHPDPDPDGSFSGYLATPAAGKARSFCAEIFGVNATMRQVADYYAEEGYTVLVPDLFWRPEPGIELGDRGEDFQRALGLYQRFDEALGSRMSALPSRPAPAPGMRRPHQRAGLLPRRQAGLPGCLQAAGRRPCRRLLRVGIEHALDEAARVRGRPVLHIAAQDGFCPPESQARIGAALGGRDGIEVYVYPGVDHAFARCRRRALRQAQRPDGAPALDRRAASRDGAALRFRHCGTSTASTNSPRATSTPPWRRWSPSPTSTIFRP